MGFTEYSRGTPVWRESAGAGSHDVTSHVTLCLFFLNRSDAETNQIEILLKYLWKMSKNISKKEKQKLAEGSTKESDDVNCGRKRGRQNLPKDSPRMVNKQPKIQTDGAEKKSARRKIDFNENQRKTVVEKVKTNNRVGKSLQLNNNSMTAPGQLRKMNLRNKPRSNLDIEVNKSASLSKDKQPEGRVQWTKEFLQKIRHSNERHLAQKELARENAANSVKRGNDKFCDSFQELMIGDGIVMTVEGNDFEELDYEDDLSVDEAGIEAVVVPVQTHDANSQQVTVDEVRPGTSGYVPPSNTNLDQKHIDELLSEKNQDKIFNNPTMQRMMQRFFDERFKEQCDKSGLNDTICEAGTNGNFKNKKRNELNVGINRQIPGCDTVKSPSDTTVYVPALHKKLTDNLTGQQMPILRRCEQSVPKSVVGMSQ